MDFTKLLRLSSVRTAIYSFDILKFHINVAKFGKESLGTLIQDLLPPLEENSIKTFSTRSGMPTLPTTHRRYVICRYLVPIRRKAGEDFVFNALAQTSTSP